MNPRRHAPKTGKQSTIGSHARSPTRPRPGEPPAQPALASPPQQSSLCVQARNPTPARGLAREQATPPRATLPPTGAALPDVTCHRGPDLRPPNRPQLAKKRPPSNLPLAGDLGLPASHQKAVERRRPQRRARSHPARLHLRGEKRGGRERTMKSHQKAVPSLSARDAYKLGAVHETGPRSQEPSTKNLHRPR